MPCPFFEIFIQNIFTAVEGIAILLFELFDAKGIQAGSINFLVAFLGSLQGVRNRLGVEKAFRECFLISCRQSDGIELLDRLARPLACHADNEVRQGSTFKFGGLFNQLAYSRRRARFNAFGFLFLVP